MAAQPDPQQHRWVRTDPPAPECRERPAEPRGDPREPLHFTTHTTTPQNTTLHGFSAFKEKENKLHPLVRARPLIKHLLKASKTHYKYPRIQHGPQPVQSAVQARGGETRRSISGRISVFRLPRSCPAPLCGPRAAPLRAAVGARLWFTDMAIESENEKTTAAKQYLALAQIFSEVYQTSRCFIT